VLEATGLVLGLLTLIGLVILLVRRFTVSKVRIVTSKADWAVMVVLLGLVCTGIHTAVFVPWGSSWFASSAVPYLRSLFVLHPDVSYLVTLPWGIKLHILSVYLLVAIFPYTRLVHLLVVPLPYLWRKPQVVRWRGLPDRGGDKVRF
jgi:nitrate reductase gamma subunit